MHRFRKFLSDVQAHEYNNNKPSKSYKVGYEEGQVYVDLITTSAR